MRSFPGAARRRAAATSVALVSLAAMAVPPAHARADEDDLEHRQRTVEDRIDDASQELDEASRQASRADAVFDRARDRLSAARAEFRTAKADVAAARERDAQLQAELEQAERDLDAANAAYAAGVAAVEEQRAVVRGSVIGSYADGDPRLRALGSLMETSSLEELTTQRLGDQVVTGQQTFAFERLEEVEAQLAEQQDAVEDAKVRVETKRQEAADHLTAMRALFAQKSAAKAQVRGAVGSARDARRQALSARARDRGILQALRQREAEISDRLEALAERQADRGGFTGDSGGFLSYPVNGSITSPYGYRTHPIYGYYSLHDGTDFGAPCGAPLYAAAGGRVIDTYYDSVYGNRLYLSVGNVNGKNLVLVYNHLSGYRAQEGDVLDRGDVLGSVGTTGWSTGCHLHFTVMANGTPVDPANYL